MAGLTNFPNGISSMGVPINGGNAFGTTYFVDATGGSDGNSGKDSVRPFKTLTKAFATVSHYDTIICKPGNYTGNYTTQVNAGSAYVTLIGVRTHENGLACWAGATTASSPIIDVRARGWRIEGFEFDCPTASSGIRLTKSTDGSTHRCDYTTIANNIFTTGLRGIEANGGGTHVHIHNNKFTMLNETGAFAIEGTNSDNQVPAFWVIEDNLFSNNLNHIGPASTTYGWSDTVFRRNVFQSDSTIDATTICDMRVTAGVGNQFLDNYLDVATASWNTATNVRGNATDFASGNHMNDADQSTAMNVS